MPSADGFIRSTADGRFVAAFWIDDIMFNFSAGFASSVPINKFVSNTATLQYPDFDSISSDRPFEGRIGPTRISLNLLNGPTINGLLDMPIFPGSTVSGSGVWTQN